MRSWTNYENISTLGVETTNTAPGAKGRSSLQFHQAENYLRPSEYKLQISPFRLQHIKYVLFAPKTAEQSILFPFMFLGEKELYILSIVKELRKIGKFLLTSKVMKELKEKLLFNSL